MSSDILIFVEDPGPANFVAPLPDVFRREGWSVVTLTAGLATGLLSARGVAVEALPSVAEGENVLSSLHPRLLMVGAAENPDSMGLSLLRAARSARVPSVGVIDARMNAEKRFRGRSKDALAYAPDWLFVPDNWTKEAFVSLGFSGVRAVVCGHPHYDHIRNLAEPWRREDRTALRRRLFARAAEAQKIVIFVCEGSRRTEKWPAEVFATYTLAGRGDVPGRTEAVLEEFLDAAASIVPRPYLVLRIHPKDERADYAAYLHAFDQVSDGGSPLEAVYAADLAVGMTSMLLLEAALLDRPTLSIVPRPSEREWLPSVGLGLTPCVASREELRAVLPAMLSGPDACIVAEREQSVITGAAERIVSVIHTLLS